MSRTNPGGALTALGPGLILCSLAACAPPEPCVVDDDCGPGQTCNAQGRCVDGPLLDDGAPCQTDATCRSGWCHSHGGQRVCSRACDEATDCVPGQTCRPSQGPDGELLLACLAGPGAGADGALCRDDEDCQSGLCHEFLCTRPCPCAGASRCTAQTLARAGSTLDVALCLPAFALERAELGPVATPVGGVELALEVPAGLASFTVVLVDDDGLRPALTRLVAPDGTVLLDLDDDTPDLNPGYHYPGAVALRVPASDLPATRPQAGTWRAQVGTFDPAQWDSLGPVDGALERVELVFERAGLQGGLLDLHLHFATATGLHAATAPEDTEVQALLDTLQATYRERVGVALGDVRFSDLPAAAAQVADGDQVRTLCAAQAQPGAHGVAVNVLLVQELAFTAGLAGGIPGPPGVYGSPASGIVLAYQGDGTHTGVLLAHEIGHFLGLRHTTETTGGRHDPISDTPECAVGTAATDCPAYGNLMFPIFPLRPGLSLSDGQVRVLRGDPALYQVALPEVCASGIPATDLSADGFGSGSTRDLADRTAATCGGVKSGEQALVYRGKPAIAGGLRVTLHALDFDAVLSVRAGACDDARAELGCSVVARGESGSLQLPAPLAAPLIVLVDGQASSAGEFWVEVGPAP